MANFTEKYTAGTYTVNTGHAKCPNYLYIIDEGSGVTLADDGKASAGHDITLANASMWSTDDLDGAGGNTSPTIICEDGSAWHAVGSNTTFSASSSILLVGLVRIATTPAASDRLFSVGIAATNTEYFYCGVQTTGRISAVYLDTAISQISRDASTTNYADDAWHLVAVMAYESGGNVIIKAAVDSAGWSATTTSGSATTLPAFDRLAIGRHAGSGSAQGPADAEVGAFFVYTDAADPVNDWDNTFISSLYTNPWQFLSTTQKYLKMLVHPSAIGQVITEGIVLAESTSSPLTIVGDKIGEFVGGSPQYTFVDGSSLSPATDAGYAVLKVPVADFGGSALTTTNTPFAVARNASYTTGLVACTVVDE